MFSPGEFYILHDLNLSLGDCGVSLTHCVTLSRVLWLRTDPSGHHHSEPVFPSCLSSCRAELGVFECGVLGGASIPPLEAAAPSEQNQSTGTSLKADSAMQESLVPLPTGTGEGMRRCGSGTEELGQGRLQLSPVHTLCLHWNFCLPGRTEVRKSHL